MTGIIDAVSRADRRAGTALRGVVRGIPGGTAAASAAAAAMAPVFQGLVAVLVMSPGTRSTGARAAIAGGVAACIARVARDAMRRGRPGPRSDGGLPSRHAAAATAISVTIARNHPVIGAVAGLAVAVGLIARVGSADHDPLDIITGIGLGWAVADATRRRGWR